MRRGVPNSREQGGGAGNQHVRSKTCGLIGGLAFEADDAA
jgi:hypothetical protein